MGLNAAGATKGAMRKNSPEDLDRAKFDAVPGGYTPRRREDPVQAELSRMGQGKADLTTRTVPAKPTKAGRSGGVFSNLPDYRQAPTSLSE